VFGGLRGRCEVIYHPSILYNVLCTSVTVNVVYIAGVTLATASRRQLDI